MRIIAFAATWLVAAVVAAAAGSAADAAAQTRSAPGARAAGGHAEAVGKPGNPKKVARTIEVVMTDDMKFTPATVNVKRGETIRFVLSNAGQVKHEMVIGPMAELKRHAEMMRKMPGMEHADPNMMTLAPGDTGGLIWQFTRAGRFDFACLQPGHFEAGMMGKVVVK